MITPSFDVVVESGRLRVIAENGLLMITGEITFETASALRELAAACESVRPWPASAAVADLFGVGER